MPEQQPSLPEETPEQIGEYKISRVLSSGVMSKTFMANVGKNYFAIKTYFPEYAEKLDHAPKFKENHELAHDNIITYKDIKYDETWQHFFIMDYLEVRPISYKRLYGQGHHRILELFIKIAEAIKLAHDGGVIHGNLKPSNILVRREEKTFMPLVADFGIAYIYEEEYFQSKNNFHKVFPYMAPETIEAFTSGGTLHAPEKASDVYSLTTVLCEVLTGRPMYDDVENLEELLEAKKNRRFRVVSVNFPSRKIDVAKLNDFINKCLSYESSGRIQDMESWKEGLAECLIEQEAAATEN